MLRAVNWIEPAESEWIEVPVATSIVCTEKLASVISSTRPA